MKIHVKLKIFGKVQKVWFRASTKRKADELAICGIVKNETDGTVYAELEGTASQIDQMMKWCEKGPPLARITKIEKEVGKLVNFTSFEIIRR